jgi:hypothetical protein
MLFDAKASEMVRKAVAEKRYDLLYVMVPADDGGQTYEMKCKICGEFGNILADKFSHAKIARAGLLCSQFALTGRRAKQASMHRGNPPV